MSKSTRLLLLFSSFLSLPSLGSPSHALIHSLLRHLLSQCEQHTGARTHFWFTETHLLSSGRLHEHAPLLLPAHEQTASWLAVWGRRGGEKREGRRFYLGLLQDLNISVWARREREGLMWGPWICLCLSPVCTHILKTHALFFLLFNAGSSIRIKKPKQELKCQPCS